MNKRVGILVFDRFEPLDVVGPFEIFTFAREVGDRFDPLFSLQIIGERLLPVESAGGLKVIPAADFSAAVELDLLVIPGGPGVREVSGQTVTWLQAAAKVVPHVAGVCSGTLLLARAGLLDQKRATTHWLYLDELRQNYPHVEVVDNERWVDDGAVTTCQGVSAGIDMSLHILEQMSSLAVAEWTAKLIQYRWDRVSATASTL